MEFRDPSAVARVRHGYPRVFTFSLSAGDFFFRFGEALRVNGGFFVSLFFGAREVFDNAVHYASSRFIEQSMIR